MAGFATGKFSKSISDRSGMEFPYDEMVKEWNGSLVHISEYEPKQPQIRRKTVTADRIALQNSRSQDFTFQSGGSMWTTINLTLPGEFAYMSSGMVPDDGSEQNRQRQLQPVTGSVTIVIS